MTALPLPASGSLRRARSASSVSRAARRVGDRDHAVDRFDTAGLSRAQRRSRSRFQGARLHPADEDAADEHPLALRRRRGEAGHRRRRQRCRRSEPGVALGTAFGPVQTSVDYMQEYVEKGAALAPPQLFAESVANAPGSHIAIECDLARLQHHRRRSASRRRSRRRCMQRRRSSREPFHSAIIGGVEEVNEMVVQRARSPRRARSRDGMTEHAAVRPHGATACAIGEGSAIFIAEAAPSRQPYGWLVRIRHRARYDGHRSPTGERAIARGRHGDACGDRRRGASRCPTSTPIYASANGTMRGDRWRCARSQQLFGDAIPPVVATKAYFGEYAAGGGFSSPRRCWRSRSEAARVVRIRGIGSGDAIHAGRDARAATLRHVLVNSLSAGGGIVCAVLSREAHDERVSCSFRR